MSRPKKDVKRSEEYRIRLFPKEKELISRVASEANTTIADLIRIGLNVVIRDPDFYLRSN